MIYYVPLGAIGLRDLELLEESLAAAPENERLKVDYILVEMSHLRMLLFRFAEDGLLVVGRNNNRLNVVAFNGLNSAFRLREVAADLRRMAADWKCDTIETTVYDLRLARAIQKAGARVESVNLVLSVE